MPTLFDDGRVRFDGAGIPFDGLPVIVPVPPVIVPVPATGAGGGGAGVTVGVGGRRFEREFRPDELEKFFGIPHHPDLMAGAGQFVWNGTGVVIHRKTTRSGRRSLILSLMGFAMDDALILTGGR